ncbi:hypothetical protein [Streptomyces noursei]|uniref:hypothetical protein n=1 Tax=Streptomyces noursei TaxID=1971 RepID=UPI001674BA01|nr:hypothetical protein [Streptomyces noursei]MCZ1020158.1 hypothetical protein [Streptomyces noursei]
MIEQEAAVRIVEDELDRENQRWSAMGVESIRGMPVRTAVDDLHDEITEIATAQGRLPSVRALRRKLPKLTPAQALHYVDALLDGSAPPPPHLTALATEQLVAPINPVLTVTTLRGPHGTT